MLDGQVMKRFRVIVKNRMQRVRGMRRGEEFEALWPDPWLERRIATHHIEMLEDPKPKMISAKAVSEETPELTEEV